jgi:hypothetical protein
VAVLSIERMRKRLPLIVFIFLVLILVMVVGIACACLTDHPMQPVERAVAAIPAAPPVMDAWPVLMLGLFAAPLLLVLPVAARDRASPALLQRFLF